jgi:hypothetical protein
LSVLERFIHPTVKTFRPGAFKVTKIFAALLTLAFLAAARAEGPAATPEARAIAYLVQEVPRWSRENHCYSCHNNGDAARALYAAIRASRPVPPEALADTNRWLVDPERWDHNGGEGKFSDKRLARLQFAFALSAATVAGQVADRAALERATARLTADQAGDGAFLLEGGDALGSPATYGRSLATLVLRDTLSAAGREADRAATEKAERWLAASHVESLLDAVAVLPVVSEPGSGAAGLPEAGAQRRRCLELIARGQSNDGGWGPFASSPPESFDTAIVVLALVRFAATPRSDEMPGLRGRIARGRSFLLANQDGDGSWVETTRPAGAESYAQRLSTTGWATLALLATRDQTGLLRRSDPQR